MTFILNVLHKDMSLLAADRKAMGMRPTTTSLPGIELGDEEGTVAHDFKKITLYQSKRLALGIAGYTHEHYYTQAIEHSVSVDEALWKIRDHAEKFLRVHDRAYLLKLPPFMENSGIASFFDQNVGEFFSSRFLFSPVHNYTRLHRGADDGAQLLHVGSGSPHFEEAISMAEQDSFIASFKDSCTPESCIPWIEEAYRKVSASDPNTGDEVAFVVSTIANPEFRSIDRMSRAG